MEIIREKIKTFMQEKWVRTLQKEIWVGSNVLYSILKLEPKDRKYSQDILDKLYNFFKIPKDDFYYNKIKQFKWRIDPLWQLLYKRRKKLGLSIHQVSRMIKWSDRHLRRIESWGVYYSMWSYYLQELLKLYKFNKFEQNQILAYSISLSNILMLSEDIEKDVL